MATATDSTTTTKTPAPVPAADSNPPVPEGPPPLGAVEGMVLKAMAASFPGELTRALDATAAKHRDQLAHAAHYRPHPLGFRGVIASTREAVRRLRHTQARRDFVATLAAGDSTAGFAPPEGDRAGEASEVLAGVLGQGVEAFPDLVRLVDSSLTTWSAEVEKIRGSVVVDGGLPPQSAAWLKSDQGKPVDFLDAQIKQLTRAAELSARVAALRAARSRLSVALGRRVAAEIETAGGPAALAEALRESARLGAAAISAEAEEMITELAGEMAEVDARLKKLGVDPTAAPAPTAGRAALSLLSTRAELASRTEVLRAGAREGETSDAAALVSRALASEPSAWSEILTRSLAVPEAFPDGFSTAWRAVAMDALVEAGPADFVEPFERD